MSTVSSSSSSSSSSSTSSYSLLAKTGIGGLVSGMDTDELVYNLTSSTRTKIAKQGQAKQTLEWKQAAYQSVTTAAKDFQSKYFDVLSDTYLGSSKFFNNVTATSSSTAVTATASSAASTGTMTINSIKQLATKESIKSGAAVSSALTGSYSTDYATLASTLSGSSIGLTLDGTLRSITFDSDFVSAVTADPTASGFAGAFQSLVDTAFGATGADDRVISVSAASGSISLAAAGSRLTVSSIDDTNTTALTALGFTSGQSNVLSTSTALSGLSLTKALSTTDDTYKFTINKVDFEFASTASVSDVISKINASDAGVTLSYSAITDKFTMSSDTEGAGQNIVMSESQGNLLSAFGLTDSAVTTAGKNAILTVDGTQINRSSNNVTIDGVTLKLTATADTASTITLTTDPSSLADTMKSFVTDYNSMITLVNSLVDEEKDADYDPLTDEQKKDMTDDQIAEWNKKAEVGILQGDSTLRTMASKISSLLYTKVSDNGATLYDMGITSAGYNEKGKLTVDTDKLKAALTSSIGNISELFTADNGISKSFDTLIDSYAKTSGTQGTRGILVELAGVADTTSASQNSIYDQLQKISDTTDDLNDKLSNEEDKYWKKFTAMETALSNLNSQSSMITSFSSGS